MELIDVPLDRRMIYVTGLPRSGSTLICQLLAQHRAIYSPERSSPLAATLNQMRKHLSDDPFLLSQLDPDFDLVYQRLTNAYRGFINGWFAEATERIVVDKSRAWLRMIETVSALDPGFQMVVCIRDLTQVFGSIEAQHRQTVLLDFPDHMPASSPYVRADQLFGDNGVIGQPLKGLEYLQDMGDQFLERICYVEFESLVNDPLITMNHLAAWLGISEFKFDPERLDVAPHESDSYYRYKYRHATRSEIQPPRRHELAPRIKDEIHTNFRWFYERFYPERLDDA